jgi:flavin prenyltransferase
MVLTIGITGATGVIYGIRLLEVLSTLKNVETHLVISEAGELTIQCETDWEVKAVKKLATAVYDITDIGARISSGSFRCDGMIVAPCTVKTLSAIANSYTENLIIRAADVTLKERRKLVLMFRETPLHLGHIRNLARATEMGAIIVPPVPAFYFKPQSIQDIVDHTVGKILDIFGIQHSLLYRWDGVKTSE